MKVPKTPAERARMARQMKMLLREMGYDARKVVVRRVADNGRVMEVVLVFAGEGHPFVNGGT